MIKIYNTLTQQLETFEPIVKDHVRMYVCGPTVYDHIHIGNARPVIVFDMVKKVFEAFNYHVMYVSNITDIDDKIIDAAMKAHIDEMTLTETFTNVYIDVTKELGSDLPDQMPKATHYINQMITYINDLLIKGFAYQTPHGVYFDISKVSDYGSLSKQNKEELESDIRITNDTEKKSPQDFTLWKTTEIGLKYPSPWGEGRPGWHTECAVMNHHIFNSMIDIHGGGADLKFPHHENERAQSIAHDDHGLAKYWMHNGRLNIDNQKMSKSLGNMVLVKDLSKEALMAFRLLILAHHYRQPIQYSHHLLEEYQTIYRNMTKQLHMTALQLKVNAIPHVHSNELEDDIKHIISKDFDTPNVITKVYEYLKQMNKEKELSHKAIFMNKVLNTLQLLGIHIDVHITEEDIELYKKWSLARENKDYQEADEIRQKLMEKGYM